MIEMDKKDPFGIEKLLHPSLSYSHPSEVLSDPELGLNEKRAVLASWASDACAIEAAPSLRLAGDGPPVSFDDIMDALKTLDGEAHARTDYGKLVNRVRRLRNVFGRGESGTGSLSLA